MKKIKKKENKVSLFWFCWANPIWRKTKVFVESRVNKNALDTEFSFL